jgi:hypothetical protein
MLAEPSVMNGPTRSLAAPHDTDLPKEVAVLSGTALRTWFSEQTWSNSPLAPEAREALVNEKQRLLSHVDKTLVRRIWLVQGCLNLDELEAILKGVSACSRVILLVLDPEAVWSGPSDANKCQAIANDERLFVITHGTPIDQAKAVNTLVDVRLYAEWKPLLGKSIAAEGISHLQQFYQAFTPLLNLKAVDRATRLGSSHLFLSNALVNAVFAEQINTLGDYKDLYKNKPVLIVATGPSLNKQLDTLQKYKDHFIVIAVDPAVPILKKYGIVPQYVVSIDPKKRPYWQHNELDPSTTFLIELGCCPDVAWSSNHNYLVTSCHKDVHRLMNALGISVPLMMNGGSVATSAFNFAQFTGANPIVMIGQDLAWTGGKDHAEGYVSQYSQDILNARYERGFEVEGYDGNPVKTEKQLMGYKTWFEERIKNMPDTMVINATEGGAKIHGAVQIAFESVCKEIASSNIGSFPRNPGKQWHLNLNYLREYIKILEHLRDDVVQLEKEILDGIKIINAMSKVPKKSVINRIEKINSKLAEGDWKIQTVIELMGQPAVMQTEQMVLNQNTNKISLKEIYHGYVAVYKSALPGLDNSKKSLNKIIDLMIDIFNSGQVKPEYLALQNLNRWLVDGGKNLNNAYIT